MTRGRYQNVGKSPRRIAGNYSESNALMMIDNLLTLLPCNDILSLENTFVCFFFDCLHLDIIFFEVSSLTPTRKQEAYERLCKLYS